MKSETFDDSTRCIVGKTCMALIWLQTMVWSFILVGAAGLSVYCWFENPEPWTSIGHIWTVAGGLTLAVLVLSLLLNGLASIAGRLTHSGKKSLFTR